MPSLDCYQRLRRASFFAVSETQRLKEHEKPTERSYGHSQVWGECTKEVTYKMKSSKRDRAEGALYKVAAECWRPLVT